jgi:DNA-binding MarR family transcriptional regulator
VVLLATVGLLFASAVWAQEDVKKPRKQPQEAPQYQIPVLNQWLEGISLTEEEKRKVEALCKEYAPTFDALQKRMNEIFTEEQLKARKEIAAKAKAEGKKPQEIGKLQQEAVKLTPEQKEKWAKIQADRRELQQKLAKALLEVLTPDHRAVVEPRVAKLLKAAPPKKDTPSEKPAKKERVKDKPAEEKKVEK